MADLVGVRVVALTASLAMIGLFFLLTNLASFFLLQGFPFLLQDYFSPFSLNPTLTDPLSILPFFFPSFLLVAFFPQFFFPSCGFVFL